MGQWQAIQSGTVNLSANRDEASRIKGWGGKRRESRSWRLREFQYRRGALPRTTEIERRTDTTDFGCVFRKKRPYSIKDVCAVIPQRFVAMVFRIALTMCLLGICGTAPSLLRAGMILDGVSDSLYTAHGAQFAAVGKVGGASGVLIAPNWVLTAGHVVPANFTVGGNTYAMAESIKHPQFLANGNDINYGFDIALIRLAANVVGIAPIPIYQGTNELGATISMVGYGATGVGSTGVTANPGTLRGGTNTMEEFYSFDDGPSGQVGAANAVLLTDFDAPTSFDATGKFNTLGTSATTSLEYQLASGDSGGGAFIQEGGQWYVAGIHSFVDSQRNWTGKPGDSSLLFGYGAVSGMTRVSSFQNFIQTHTGVPEPSSMALCCLAAAVAMPLARRLRRDRPFRRDPPIA